MNDELQKSFLQSQNDIKREELEKHSDTIDEFIKYCNSRHISLTKENIDYIQTIGIIAKYPNIVYLLNEKIIPDKDNLVGVSLLESEYRKRQLASGYYYADKYMVMAHPYFRRGYHECNNFAPRFVDVFWKYNKTDIQKYIAIDSNKVRINVDDTICMELDTWYGAKFQRTIKDIDDGIVKLRPPSDFNSSDIEAAFGGTYALDMKWSSKNGIKTFQAEEFKSERCRISRNGKDFFPSKYLHAEFDMSINRFRHFDGAIHFYTSNEYYQRRDSDFNYNNKNNAKLKASSIKLFKVNGQIDIADWMELTSQYLTGNPLVFEYFEGSFPKYLQKIIQIKRKRL